ncbi:MAG: MBL fold metallo-hydrolase [Candidatus Aenigmatarchaeota archaeon]
MSFLVLFAYKNPGQSVSEPKDGNKFVISKEIENMTITTLYDNYEYETGLEFGWGFSCLIETEDRKILFDTGESPRELIENMKSLDINPESIDELFLSHRHCDHVGGLEGFLKENNNVTVYILESFPGNVENIIENAGSKYLKMNDFVELHGGVMTTGSLGMSPKEQSLVINTEKGLVIVTGCAHPGIVKILDFVRDKTGEDIYLVMGGFHLGSYSEREIMDIVGSFRKLGVEKVAPSHCSGDTARKIFEREYGENFIENGIGRVIEFSRN